MPAEAPSAVACPVTATTRMIATLRAYQAAGGGFGDQYHGKVAKALLELADRHDRRVAELIAANNREVEARRHAQNALKLAEAGAAGLVDPESAKRIADAADATLAYMVCDWRSRRDRYQWRIEQATMTEQGRGFFALGILRLNPRIAAAEAELKRRGVSADLARPVRGREPPANWQG